MLLEDLKKHGVEAVFKGDWLEIKFPNPVLSIDCYFIVVKSGGVELRYRPSERYVDIWLPPPVPYEAVQYAIHDIECIFIDGNVVKIEFNSSTTVSKSVDID